MKFDELLKESAPSNAGYIETAELRRLYYGRMDIYVAFSNSDKLDYSGFDGATLVRPYAIQLHSIDNIIGKKVGTSMFYGHVARVKPHQGTIIKDIRNYSSEDYKTDLEVLGAMPYIDNQELQDVISVVNHDPRMHYAFEKIWNVMKMMSLPRGKHGDKYWRRLIKDLDYAGFYDSTGIGIMGKLNRPVNLVFREEDLTVYDIVPIQKHRHDTRKVIIDLVNIKNRLARVRRNNVAKVRTDDNRDTTLNKIVRY
jgi:hypothetical protein